MSEARGNFDQLIAGLATAASKATAATLAPYGLSPLAFGILSWCYRGEAHSVSELADVFPVDGSAISRQVTRLEGQGLITKERPFSDQRRVQVRMTEEGLALVRRLEEHLAPSRALIMQGVSDSEWAAFTATAHKLLSNLEALARTRTLGNRGHRPPLP
ncbi:MAG: MarR family transcriptional regulator [Chloroflexi bacterium]|nr:MarR family transcriptional regulator [Chloroflexota bacterium]